MFTGPILVLVPQAPAASVVGADNGLHLQGTDVYLGGVLLEDTTIDLDGFEIEFIDDLNRVAMGNGVFRTDMVAAPNETQILQDDSSIFLSTTGADGQNGFAMESLAGVEQMVLSLTYSDFEYLFSITDAEVDEYYFDPVTGEYSERLIDATSYLIQVISAASDITSLEISQALIQLNVTDGVDSSSSYFHSLYFESPTVGLQELGADPANIANIGQLYVLIDEVLYYQDATGNITDLSTQAFLPLNLLAYTSIDGNGEDLEFGTPDRLNAFNVYSDFFLMDMNLGFIDADGSAGFPYLILNMEDYLEIGTTDYLLMYGQTIELAATVDFSDQLPILLPGLTDAQRNALSAAARMCIYNTTTNKLNFYNGSAWRAVDDSAV